MVETWDLDSPTIVKQINTLLGQLRLEGVILLPPLSDQPVVLNRLQDASLPVVRIAPRTLPNKTPSVGTIKDYAAARQVTAHLLRLAHKLISFIMQEPRVWATEQRYLGFVDEMRAHQTPVNPNLVQTGNFDFDDGLICAERMLCATTLGLTAILRQQRRHGCRRGVHGAQARAGTARPVVGSRF